MTTGTRPTPAPTPAPTRARPRRLPVLGFLAATGLSVAANTMVAVVVPWLVLTRTDSPAQAGLVGAVALAAAVPALLLGGPLIDRWGRRRVSVCADLLSAGAVAALPLLDAVVGLTLVTTLALVGLGALFDGPGAAARESARPELAAYTDTGLDALNARGEALDGAGQVVGPALAGIGLGAIGAMSSLWVAAGMFVLAAVATAWSLPPDSRPAGRRHEPYWTAAVTGLRTLWQDRTLRAIALLGTVAMGFVAPFTLVLTAHLAPQGRPDALGYITAALAVGGIAGALGYEPLARRIRRRTALVAGLVAAAAGFAALATLPDVWVMVVIAGLTGLVVGPINPILAAVTQQRTPPEVLGRVVSTTWSLSLLAGPLGMLAVGFALEIAAPGVLLAAMAAGLFVTAVYAFFARGLRRIERDQLAIAAGEGR